MKIVYTGIQYDDYDLRKGLSFEHVNFYESLRRLPGVEVEYFPYDRILAVGRDRFNEELVSHVRRVKPDLLFAFMLSDELQVAALEELKKLTTTVGWFADDHWRFHNYSRYYASRFTWAVTTYSQAVEWYREAGILNVVRSQWASNAAIYKPEHGEHNSPSVSFVGSWSRPRAEIVEAIDRAGIGIGVYGEGWPDGRVSEEKMIELFSRSKINLALNPPAGYFTLNSLARLFLRRSSTRIVPDFHFIRNVESWLHRGIPQIKARHFEIPACGGFLLTSYADDLDKYYEIGKEIVVYTNQSDLIEKVRYYLRKEDERRVIAEAGHRRTLRDHTYDKRLTQLFRELRLTN